jgi:8-oxo-dGTP pyrophosphatase MutT (NUDIX family)
MEQAAIRELEEEAGLKLTTIAHKSVCVYSYDFPPEFLRRHNPVNAGQKLCFVVLHAPKDVQVQVDKKEVDSYVWVLPEQLSQYVTRPAYLKAIQDVLADYEAAKPASP